jgi:hypothetical protein
MQNQVTMLHNLPDYSTNDSDLQYVSYTQTVEPSSIQSTTQNPHEFSYMTQRNGIPQFPVQPVQHVQHVQPVQAVQAVQPVLPSNSPLHPSYIPYAAYVNHPESSNINTIVNEKVNTEMKKLEHENKIDEMTRKFQHFEDKYNSKMGTVEAFTSDTGTNVIMIIGGVAIFVMLILLLLILGKLNSIQSEIVKLL